MSRSNMFEVRSGVQQGCTIAPLLCTFEDWCRQCSQAGVSSYIIIYLQVDFWRPYSLILFGTNPNLSLLMMLHLMPH